MEVQVLVELLGDAAYAKMTSLTVPSASFAVASRATELQTLASAFGAPSATVGGWLAATPLATVTVLVAVPTWPVRSFAVTVSVYSPSGSIGVPLASLAVVFQVD